MQSQFYGSLKDNKGYTLGYVKFTSTNISTIWSNFLKYMGVQSHMYCDIRIMPLIVPTDQNLNYNFGHK